MSETLDFAQGDRRACLVEQLRRQVGGCEARPAEEAPFSSGVAELDRLLPAGGWRYGMLTEWLSELARGSAATLSQLSAREACRPGGVLVVIDRRQTFYPPAAAAWGIDLERLLIVRPGSLRDELWAAVQALRSPAAAAVWAMIDRLDSRAFRRLQLAAQAGRTLGLLLRPMSARSEPSWADVRLGVSGEQGARSREFLPAPRSPLPAFCRCIQVRILRSRTGRAGGSLTLDIDDAARTVREAASATRPNIVVRPRHPTPDTRHLPHAPHPLPVVSELADPAAHSFPARA